MSDKQPTINYGTVKGTNEHGLFELRTERDRLLVESDWTQSPDSPLTDEKKKEWATYRQSLRDLPLSSSPQLDSCLIYTSPSPRDVEECRMPSSA